LQYHILWHSALTMLYIMSKVYCKWKGT